MGDIGEGASGVMAVRYQNFHSDGGWEYSTPVVSYKNVAVTYYGYGSQSEAASYTIPNADPNGTTCAWTTAYVFSDPSEQRHPLGLGALSISPANIRECPQATGPNSHTDLQGGVTSAVTDRGDVFTTAHLQVPWPVSGVDNDLPSQVATADGTTYTFGGGGAFAGGSGGDGGFYSEITPVVQDRNGNQVKINVDWKANTLNYVDGVGRTALTLTGHGNLPSPQRDTIAVSGLPLAYQVEWTTLTPSGAYLYGNTINNGYSICRDSPAEHLGRLGVPTHAVTRITLPDGTFYAFDYDPVYGLLRKVVYPNLGTVTYDWQMQPRFEQAVLSRTSKDFLSNIYDYQSTLGSNVVINGSGGEISYPCAYSYDWPAVVGRQVSYDGVNMALSQSFQYATTATGRTTSVITNDLVQGTQSTRIYDYNLDLQYDDNDPYAFDAPQYGMGQMGAVLLAGPLRRPPIYSVANERNVTDQDGAGNVLKSVKKSWLEGTSLLTDETATLGLSGPQAEASYFYATQSLTQSPLRMTKKTETNYDGAQLITNFSYQDFIAAPQPYQYRFGQSVFDRPAMITTSLSDGGASVAETDYSNYDRNGNVGTITRKCWVGSTACTDESTQFTYDSSGLVHTEADGLGNVTAYDRTDAFTTGSAPFPTNAYVTTITHPPTNGAAHVERFTYDYASGHLNAAQDENGNWTRYSYDDPFGRLT